MYVIFILYLFISLPLFFLLFLLLFFVRERLNRVTWNQCFYYISSNNESHKEKRKLLYKFVVCSGDVSLYNKELLTTIKRGQDPMKNGDGCSVRFSTTTSVALGQGTDDDDDGMLSEHQNCCVCGYF